MAPGSNLEYLGLLKVEGPLIFVQGVDNVGFGEMAEVIAPDGEVRLGRVLSISEDLAVVEVFAGTSGLSTADSKVSVVVVPTNEELVIARETEQIVGEKEKVS